MSQYVPDEIAGSLKRYVEDRIPCGGFLTAILANDLYLACARADVVNYAWLREIVGYVDSYLPAICHGNYERVRAWLERRENAPSPETEEES